jgi:hypothetical protein
MNLAFEISLFILLSDFLHAVKTCDMGPTALFPSEEKRVKIYRPYKSNASAKFEPANLGFNDNHANHYTTDEIYSFLRVTATKVSKVK